MSRMSHHVTGGRWSSSVKYDNTPVHYIGVSPGPEGVSTPPRKVRVVGDPFAGSNARRPVHGRGISRVGPSGQAREESYRSQVRAPPTKQSVAVGGRAVLSGSRGLRACAGCQETCQLADGGSQVRDLCARRAWCRYRDPPAAALRIASATRTTCTISATRWTRTMWAPRQHGGGHGRGGRPVAGLGVKRPGRGGQERLARGPNHQRKAKLSESIDSGQRRETVLGTLGEAQAGVDEDAVPPDAALDGPFDAALQLARHLRHDIAVFGVRIHVAGPAAHVHEDHGRRPPGHQRAQLGIVLKPADVVDDGRALVERLCARPPPCRCRSKTGCRPSPPARAAPAEAARSRSAAPTGAAPGRVDSAPTSITSAPAAAMACAMSRAFAGSARRRHPRRNRA